ncbi:MAG: MBOAT family protein, partial [Lachnospiraceae bacterium]|nr:MBOAT family protein [Lachnospiraceae bacterium]
VRLILNLFVVWILTGIWHGANYTFIAWGLGYFVLLLIEKLLIKPNKRKCVLLKIVWRIITLLCINFGWVIFNSSSISEGIKYCLSMIGFFDNMLVIDETIIRYLRDYGFYIIIGIILSTPICKVFSSRMNYTALDKVLKFVQPVLIGVLFLWSVSFILLGAHNPFIYFNF